MLNRIWLSLFFVLTFFILSTQANAKLINDLIRLQHAYPDSIASVSEQSLVWKDGSVMHVPQTHPFEHDKLEAPSLSDQISNVFYLPGIPNNLATFRPSHDAGRIRYEPFFRKMYGSSKEEVEKKLVTVFWMPAVFGYRYPLLVTTVNGVDKTFRHLSDELEKLPPDYYKFLENPGGTFNWRVIAHTSRLSPHSFGISIDINTSYSHYWQWDLLKYNRLIREDALLGYRNDIPWEIVLIFEKHGFIWGGKWRHYDTMHFEYRPELTFYPSFP